MGRKMTRPPVQQEEPVFLSSREDMSSCGALRGSAALFEPCCILPSTPEIPSRFAVLQCNTRIVVKSRGCRISPPTRVPAYAANFHLGYPGSHFFVNKNVLVRTGALRRRPEASEVA